MIEFPIDDAVAIPKITQATTAKDLTGQRFGRLVAICATIERKDAKIIWLFKCDCGNKVKIVGKHATSGNTKSCGCYQKDQLEKSFEKRRVVKICEICSKSFKVKLSHSTYEGTYCSKSCMANGYKTRLLKIENPNYRHGKSKEQSFYNEYYRKFRKNNKEKIAHQNRLSKAKRRKAEGSYTLANVWDKFREQNCKCFWCLSLLDNFHVDHVIPIIEGGSNWPSNIVISCPPCNLQKQRKMPEEWFKYPNCRAIRYDYPGKTGC